MHSLRWKCLTKGTDQSANSFRTNLWILRTQASSSCFIAIQRKWHSTLLLEIPPDGHHITSTDDFISRLLLVNEGTISLIWLVSLPVLSVNVQRTFSKLRVMNRKDGCALMRAPWENACFYYNHSNIWFDDQWHLRWWQGWKRSWWPNAILGTRYGENGAETTHVSALFPLPSEP